MPDIEEELNDTPSEPSDEEQIESEHNSQLDSSQVQLNHTPQYQIEAQAWIEEEEKTPQRLIAEEKKENVS